MLPDYTTCINALEASHTYFMNPSENPPCADWVPPDQIDIFDHFQPFPPVQIRFPQIKSIYLAIFLGGFSLGMNPYIDHQ